MSLMKRRAYTSRTPGAGGGKILAARRKEVFYTRHRRGCQGESVQKSSRNKGGKGAVAGDGWDRKLTTPRKKTKKIKKVSPLIIAREIRVPKVRASQGKKNNLGRRDMTGTSAGEGF